MDLHRELVILIAQDSVVDFPVSSKVVAMPSKLKMQQHKDIFAKSMKVPNDPRIAGTG